MDLNGLKRCNDCFGYAAGDALICRVADALNDVFPGEACRIGGDEFVVICCPVTQENLNSRWKLCGRHWSAIRWMQPSARFGSRWSKTCPPSSAKPTTGCTGKKNARSAQRGPRFRRTVLDTIKHIINKQRPPGGLPAGAAVFRGTLFFLPYFAASTSTPT